jgi:hypothetical protein
MPRVTRKQLEDAKQAAKLFGRIGGLKGGRARTASMTAEERSESARNAALAGARKMTPAQRSARARKAAAARHGRKGKSSPKTGARKP